MSIKNEIENHHLSYESEFSALAQAAINTYYLTPYQNEESTQTQIARYYHGGVHVSSVALNIEMFIALYQKYNSSIIPEEFFFPQQQKLLLLTAIYHDSGNFSETQTVSLQSHGTNFYNDMLLLGFKKEEIIPFQRAMDNKDSPLDETSSQQQILYQKLLHDADSLDVMRIVDNFNLNCLHIINDLSEEHGFDTEIRQIIENHRETLNFFEDDRTAFIWTTHIICEQAENCYQSVFAAEKNLFHIRAISEAAKHDLNLTLDDLNSMQPSILDIYNRRNSPLIQHKINQIKSHDSILLHDTRSEAVASELAINYYQNQGLLIRGLREISLDSEFALLKKNTYTLKKNKLEKPEQIKNYVDKMLHESEFYWRSFIYIKKNLPIEHFLRNCYVLVDPRTVNQSAYSYKRDAFSFFVSFNQFNYNPVHGGLKNQSTLKQLSNKLEEMNQRRLGEIPDKNLHYYGQKSLAHNEVLTTYCEEDVIGIIVINTPVAAREALLLRTHLGTPYRPFYHYSAEDGLKKISLHDVIQQSELEWPRDNKFMLYINKHLHDLAREFKDALTCSMTQRTIQGVRRSFKINLKAFNNEIQEQIITYLALNNTFELDDNILKISLPFYKEDNQLYNATISTFNSINTIIIQNSQMQLLKSIDVEQIKNQEISIIYGEKFHAGFTFIHPNQPEIQCKLFIEEKPIIIFEREGIEILKSKTDLLPTVSLLFYQQTTQRLNNFLEQPDNQEHLNLLGLNSLKWDVRHEKSSEKSYLVAQFDAKNNISQEQKKAQLIALFKIPEKQSESSKKLCTNAHIFFDSIPHVCFFEVNFKWFVTENDTKKNPVIIHKK